MTNEQGNEAALTRLEERLIAATGPDRELDRDLWWVMDPRRSQSAFNRASLGLPKEYDPNKPIPRGVGFIAVEAMAPTYTASIDAALTLVPDGWEWLVSNRAPAPHTGRAYINNRTLIYIGGGMTPNPRHRSAEVTAPTAPLAICLASTRAHQRLLPKPETGERT